MKYYITELDEKEKGANEKNIVGVKNLAAYIDEKHNIGVLLKKVKTDLQVGKIYEFKNIYDGDDTEMYLVLKKDEENCYLVPFYDGKIIRRVLEDGAPLMWWDKCDVKEKLGIDLNEWLERIEKKYRKKEKKYETCS